jgi:hypothetical protein
LPSAEARAVVVSRGAGFTLVAMRFPEQRRSVWFWAARRCETGRRGRMEEGKGWEIVRNEIFHESGKE